MATEASLPAPTSRNSHTFSHTSQTLLDHLHEIRRRTVWIVLAVIVGATAGYAVQDQLISFLLAPIGNQQLVYLTPIGGFNFLFKISLYAGIAVAIPVTMYQVYKFLEPLMRRKLRIGLYAVMSCVLAVGGGAFAYYISLPAAMHFLTSFTIEHVTAMLTVDSYLAFVITYLLGFAALFQIPLLLLIINTITPLPPGKLMKIEGYVILAAFVLGAIISPTPDITNQTLLAMPIVAMYQFGVVAMWLSHRRQAKRRRKTEANARKDEKSPAVTPATALPATRPQTVLAQQSIDRPPVTAPLVQPIAPRPQPRSLDGMSRGLRRPISRPIAPRPRPLLSRPTPPPPRRATRGSMDGILPAVS